MNLPAARTRRQAPFIAWFAKGYDQNSKRAQFIKIAFLFLGGLFLVFILIELWQGIRYSVWDGKRQLTFVFEQENRLGYIKINKELDEVKVLTLSDNVMVPLAYGYQEYKANKVKLLAKQEKLPLGPFLSVSFTHFLGTVTDGYVTEAKGIIPNPSLLLRQALARKAKTNFTDWDLIRLLFYLANIRSEQVEYIDLSDTSSFQYTVLPDGSEVYQPDLNKLDSFVLVELANPQFLNQTYTWEVFNGTQHPGLGNQVKRIVANSGFTVVGVRQALSFYETSFISLGKRVEKAESVKEFACYLDIPTKKGTELNDRADVVLVIGEDYWKRYLQREN